MFLHGRGAEEVTHQRVIRQPLEMPPNPHESLVECEVHPVQEAFRMGPYFFSFEFIYLFIYIYFRTCIYFSVSQVFY